MDANERVSGIIFKAVNAALPPHLYEVYQQTIGTADRDQCVIAIVARERR